MEKVRNLDSLAEANNHTSFLWEEHQQDLCIHWLQGMKNDNK